MKSYNERVQKHRNHYDNMVEREGILEEVADKLKYKIPYDELDGEVSSYVTYLNYQTNNVEKLELEIIPALSTLFDLSWKKSVDKTFVTYTSSMEFKGETFYFIFCLNPTGSCRIIPRETGKTKKISKWVEVEVPELEYIVDCEEE